MMFIRLLASLLPACYYGEANSKACSLQRSPSSHVCKPGGASTPPFMFAGTALVFVDVIRRILHAMAIISCSQCERRLQRICRSLKCCSVRIPFARYECFWLRSPIFDCKFQFKTAHHRLSNRSVDNTTCFLHYILFAHIPNGIEALTEFVIEKIHCGAKSWLMEKKRDVHHVRRLSLHFACGSFQSSGVDGIFDCRIDACVVSRNGENPEAPPQKTARLPNLQPPSLVFPSWRIEPGAFRIG